MKSDGDLIDQAIAELQGCIKIGDIVAHRSHKLSHTLVDIVGSIGVCELPDGTINKFPVRELFDVNKVKNRAVELKFQEAFIIDRNN